jgi:hypothetical protein
MNMANTTTKIGRLGLAHADFGYDAGTPLHAALRDMYTRISDNVNSRLLKAPALANGASIDIEHGLQCAFAELRVLLYTYDTGTGELTRVNPTTGYTLAATPGTPTTHVRVTNNTGSSKDVALVVVQGRGAEKLDDLDDVDLTTPAEDGQALVWDAALGQFKPGASGDASFKLQSVTDPNAVVKGGYLLLPDGRELATYDGAGALSTDFGKDLTVSLDTILGGNPANATAYYLAIDLNSLGAAVVQTDTGRKVYPITEANLVLITTTPDASNRTRYLFRGVIMSATTGTVWSGAGAKFATLAFLQQAANVPAQNPMVFTASQVVGAVGATAQIRQGHLLSEKSFPAAARDTAKLSIFGLANTPNDSYGGRNLTAANTPASAVGIFNTAGEAMALVGASSQRLYSTDVFFQPYGSSGFMVAGWFKASALSGVQTLFSRWNPTGNLKQWWLRLNGSLLQLLHSTDGSTDAVIAELAGMVTAATWCHVTLVWTGAAYKIFVDKNLVGEFAATTFANVAPEFAVGAASGGSFLTGSVDEACYVKGVVPTDVDVAKLASTRLDHNKAMAASRQLWLGRHYAGGTAPVSDLAGVVLDMADPNSVFVDLSGCDPTDKVDLMLLDTGAAGAISVPVQTPEFLLTAAIPVAGLDTNLAEAPRSMQGWQLDNDLHWQPLDLVGLVYVDAADGMKLKGDLSSLTLAVSATNPVRIVVSTTASAQAVGAAGAGISGLISQYQDSGEGDLGAIVWGAANPPAGTIVKKFHWTRAGNLVSLWIEATFSTAGTVNAQTYCYVPFPSGMPAPVQPGVASGLNVIGAGAIGAGVNGLPDGVGVSFLDLLNSRIYVRSGSSGQTGAASVTAFIQYKASVL